MEARRVVSKSEIKNNNYNFRVQNIFFRVKSYIFLLGNLQIQERGGFKSFFFKEIEYPIEKHRAIPIVTFDCSF